MTKWNQSLNGQSYSNNGFREIGKEKHSKRENPIKSNLNQISLDTIMVLQYIGTLHDCRELKFEPHVHH